MPERIPQSTTIRVPLYAVLSSDHVSAATSKTVAITISKNGAAFGNPSAGATNATEIASGWYYVDLSATDTGTVGPVIVRGTAGTIDDSTIAYNVVAYVDQTGDSYTRIGAAGVGLTNVVLPSGGLANVVAWTVAITGNITGNLSGSVGSVTGLTASNLDATVSSRLASASYTAPDNTSITAIKVQTDKITFTVANQVDANIKSVADTTVTGSGTAGSPWGP